MKPNVFELHAPISKVAMLGCYRDVVNLCACGCFYFILCKLFLCAAKLEALGRKMCVPLSTVVRIAILLIDACGLGWHSASLLICVWGSNCITQIGKIAMCQITLQNSNACPSAPSSENEYISFALFYLADEILELCIAILVIGMFMQWKLVA